MSGATIDRLEEGRAELVFDDGTVGSLPVSQLPPGAREGDRLRLALELDPAATAAAKERVEKIRGRLSSEDDGGDLTL